MSKGVYFAITVFLAAIAVSLWLSGVAPFSTTRHRSHDMPINEISEKRLEIAPAPLSVQIAPQPVRIERFPPGFNYALAANGAKVTGGTNPGIIIDGVFTGYTPGAGYAFTNWNVKPAQSFLITLKEPADVDCVRFLLWDLELDRFYRYKLEIAPDLSDKAWSLVADKSGKDEECRSWQTLRFARQKVLAIRLTGTFNSANSFFHVVELQACIEPPHGFPKQGPVRAPDKPAEALEF